MGAELTRAFCAYFDMNFLVRGLALHASLQRCCPGLRLWIMCLDEDCHRILSGLKLEGVKLLRLEDMERFDPDLLKVKMERSPLEYALTCTPILPLYVLQADWSVDMVAYLDADLYFFSDPGPLFAEMGPASIAITAHRYLPPFKSWESRTGIYNDGWVCFRRDAQALDCLRRWRGQCLQWCFNRAENGRFTEQQYLDDWPQRFAATAVLRHAGANVGPWNLGGARVSFFGNQVLIDGRPLVFFHFSGIARVAPWLYDLGTAGFRARPDRAARDGIFAPYLRELDDISRRLSRLARLALRTAGRRDEGLARQPWSLRLSRAANGIARGHWALYVNGRVL